MSTDLASTLRPAPVSWNRRFMRFGWTGLMLRPDSKTPDGAQSTGMNSEPHSTAPPTSSPEEASRAGRDLRLRSARTIQFQLSGRLKAIYADEAAIPEIMRNLAMRVEARLQGRR
jgi:hypothetical protein